MAMEKSHVYHSNSAAARIIMVKYISSIPFRMIGPVSIEAAWTIVS